MDDFRDDILIFSPAFNFVAIICIVLLVIALLMGCGNTHKHHFVRAIDGDTIIVAPNVDAVDQRQRIRLYGVDSPELPEKGGMPAKYFVEDILHGKKVRLEVKYKDRYDRTVAIVYVKGWHEPLNLILLKEGHAVISDRYCKESICDHWRKEIS